VSCISELDLTSVYTTMVCRCSGEHVWAVATASIHLDDWLRSLRAQSIIAWRPVSVCVSTACIWVPTIFVIR